MNQRDAAYRLEWGLDGLRAVVTPGSVVVIVDVLRTSSAISAAIEAECDVVLTGADQAEADIDLTDPDRPGFAEILSMTTGQRVRLGESGFAELTSAAIRGGAGGVFAGCLRNTTAIATAARALAGRHGVIAILAALDPAASLGDPRCSPEAAIARAAFWDARPLLTDAIAGSTSAIALAATCAADDITICATLDVTDSVARVVEGAFRR